MTQEILLDKIHRRLAQITIGNSALRNQGVSGIVEITRNYLYQEIKPNDIFSRLTNEKLFNNFLNQHTIILAKRYPTESEQWGTARKGLNLFFREVVYNKFLTDQFKLPTEFKEYNLAIKYLEVPLDSHVANGIIDKTSYPLPKWQSIKNLTPDDSKEFQEAASIIADKEKIARIHLDLILWRPIKN